jgi:hypothetical protein
VTVRFFQHLREIGRARTVGHPVVFDGLDPELIAWLRQHKTLSPSGRLLSIADGPAWLLSLARSLRTPYFYARTRQHEGSTQR